MLSMAGDLSVFRGDLPETTVASSVFGQRCEDVRTALQRQAAGFGGEEIRGGLRREQRGGRELERADRRGGNAERLAEPDAGFGKLPLRVGGVGDAFKTGDTGRCDFGSGDGSCGETLFEEFYQLFLELELALKDFSAALKGAGFEQHRPQPAADLPGGGEDVVPRRYREIPGMGDALLALAGGLDGHIDADPRKPGGNAAGRIGADAGRDAEHGVGSAAGGLNTGFGHAPLRAGDVEAGMMVERGERERPKIPRNDRPLGKWSLEVRFEKFPQPGIVQRAGVELHRSLCGEERLGLIPRATGE